jgi:hypothetical protein
MAITSAFTNIATTTRASKAWDPGAWDFVSGSAVGALVEYAANAPRITSSGLLVEESSTNGVINPRAEDATVGVVGSGGVVPSDWTVDAGSGGTVEVIAVNNEDGWPYVDMKFSGTLTGNPTITFNGSMVTSAAQNDYITSSVGLKYTAGTLTNISGMSITQIGRDSGGGALDVVVGAAVPFDTTHKRYFRSHQLTHADTTYTQTRLTLTRTANAATDVTVRFYVPQCEVDKAYPTSPVLPTAGAPQASTRNGDDVQIPNGSWAVGSGGAFSAYVEAALNRAPGSWNYDIIVDIGDGANDSIIMNMDAATQGALRWTGKDASSTVVAGNTGVHTAAGDVVKVAFGWTSPNDFYSNSGGDATSVSFSDTVNQHTYATMGVGLGCRLDGIKQADCYIRDCRIWPRALTDAEIDALVGA